MPKSFALNYVLFILILSHIPSFSHEKEPSILDFQIKSSVVSIKIQTNIKALFQEGLTKKLDPTVNSDLGEQNFSDDLSGNKIAELIRNNWLTIKSKMKFYGNDERLDLDLLNISVQSAQSDFEHSGISFMIEATLPTNAKFLSFSWDASLGDLVIREQGQKETLYTDYLSNGMRSAKIYLSNEKVSVRGNIFFSYVVSGVYHIVPIGYDHILFIVGLYLFSHNLRKLVLQVSIFTVAHSISLVLAGSGMIQVSSFIVEPVIAASIVYIGLENYFSTRKNPYRMIIIFVFGLLHGLGFAGVLNSLSLSGEGILVPLLGFNIGVEIGQLIVLVLCFVTIGYWFQKKSWYRKRIINPLSAGLVVIGGFWFISRII